MYIRACNIVQCASDTRRCESLDWKKWEARIKKKIMKCGRGIAKCLSVGAMIGRPRRRCQGKESGLGNEGVYKIKQTEPRG